MTRREREILKASVSWTDKTLTVNEEKAFQAGAKWADETMIEKLRELESGYEKDLDTLPRMIKKDLKILSRMYETYIQLCAKITLIEELIHDLKEE